MATQSKPHITLEKYFELERASVDRHEYLNGKVFAMAGGTAAHSIISLNITGELRGQLRGRDCTAYNGDMRIRTSPSGPLHLCGCGGRLWRQPSGTGYSA